MKWLVQSEEMEDIINKLKGGIDGLGPEYYKTFRKMLTYMLKFLFNKIMERFYDLRRMH